MSKFNLEKFNNYNFSEEPYYNEYKVHLEAINAILREIGGHVEGNNFYLDLVIPTADQMPVEGFRPRRFAHVYLAQNSQNIVEIGFNAGHSALLMLTANPNLQYVGIDICRWAYTEPCVDYLKSAFGDRVRFIKGDSREVLPELFNTFPDLVSKDITWIVDGGHLEEVARPDAHNVIERLSKNGELMLFDDLDAVPGHIESLMTSHESKGQIKFLTDIRTTLPNIGSYSQYTFVQGIFEITK